MRRALKNKARTSGTISAMIVPAKERRICCNFSPQCALLPNRLRNFTQTLNDECRSSNNARHVHCACRDGASISENTREMSGERLCTKSPYSGISLCNLCVLCVSVVWFYSEFINHRDTEDTEDTEVAQRRARSRLFVQSHYHSLYGVPSVEVSEEAL